MLNSILNFLKSLKPEMIVQAPSRINLINPLDAVEADFWMPAVAINGIENPLSVFLYIKKTKSISRFRIYRVIKNSKGYIFEIETEEELIKSMEDLKEKCLGECALIYASIYRLSKMSASFWEKFKEQNIEFGLINSIPRQSGLGGSAAIIISVLYGLSQYFKIFNNLSNLAENEFPINKDIIAEMATKIEDEDLKITAGYSDRYVISRGGLSFCSYYGKLFHEAISKEPLAVYDRIDEIYNINELPFILCYSGVIHESGSVHDKLRRLYLQKESTILKNYEKLAEIAWKARFALMKKDWRHLGEYFKLNTEIMNLIMKNAGFEYGIGLANNILIKLIENHPDVYAAKLTGAGGGGSVFALVKPNKIESVLLNWKDSLSKLVNDEKLFKSNFPDYPLNIRTQLKYAEFYRIKICGQGVSIIEKN